MFFDLKLKIKKKKNNSTAKGRNAWLFLMYIREVS